MFTSLACALMPGMQQLLQNQHHAAVQLLQGHRTCGKL
jgi:hypothetical protein